MSCTTCGHTIEQVINGIWWCPRCGTLKIEGGVPSESEPMLVQRCQTFEKYFDVGHPLLAQWLRLGCAESIYPPGSRINES